MSHFIDQVVELLGPFGTVVQRPMFGGHGVYLDGLLFALVFDNGLYLKADEINRAEFLSSGWQPFISTRGRRRTTYSFFRVPEDTLESAERILPWARSAYAAAMRARSRRDSAAMRNPVKEGSAPIPVHSEKKPAARRKAKSGEGARAPAKLQRPRRPSGIRKAAARKTRATRRKRASRRAAHH